MVRKIVCLGVVLLFSFSLVEVAWADELQELKAQMKAMQKQMQEQAEQMQSMHEKIKKLETEKAARIKTPQDMQEKVAVLEEKLDQKGNMNVNWKNGLSLETEDKQFTMKIGGRFHMDSSWFEEESKVSNAVGESSDDGEIRRGRFYMKGTMFEDYLYKLEYDFAVNPVALKDAYIGLKNIPYLGTVKAGHFFEPFGLESMFSSNCLTLIEHPLPDVAFAPFRNIGISSNSTMFDNKVTMGTGVFRNADNQGNLDSNKWNITSRMTYVPWYKDNGKKLFHIGVSDSFRAIEDTVQYRARPEAHQAQYFVDTGAVAAKWANLIGTEALLIYGPLSLQGEYMGSIVDRRNTASDAYFQGAYGYASYFLTGEHRNYSKSSAITSGISPIKNFSLKDKGFGAWELIARYSWLDLTDDDIDGGVVSDITAGLNWYLNPNMRIMWNYIHSHVNGAGDADMGLTRFQLHF